MERNLGIALLLPILTGLSTVIGSTLGFFARNPGPCTMSFSLGFAAAVMVLISFTELLPEAVENVGFFWGYAAFFTGMAAMFAVDLQRGSRPAVRPVRLEPEAAGLHNRRKSLLPDTPPDQPVTKGVYRISRHPQIVSLFVVFLGICLAIGSWAALFMLAMSKLLQHFGILAEEEVCLKRYGETYRAFMARVPRYVRFF